METISFNLDLSEMNFILTYLLTLPADNLVKQTVQTQFE